jgi:hypothetical protein
MENPADAQPRAPREPAWLGARHGRRTDGPQNSVLASWNKIVKLKTALDKLFSQCFFVMARRPNDNLFSGSPPPWPCL